MPYHPQLSERLKKLFDDAIDHGISVINRGETVLPYLLVETTNGKELTVFASDAPDVAAQGVADARQRVATDSAIEAYVIVYDGILTRTDGSQTDALILDGSERGMDFGFVFAQRYRRNEDGKITLIFGDAGPIKMSDQLLETPK